MLAPLRYLQQEIVEAFDEAARKYYEETLDDALESNWRDEGCNQVQALVLQRPIFQTHYNCKPQARR